MGEALPQPQVAVQFPPGIAGERDKARFAELRDAHEQSVPGRVIVADTEPQEFPAPQTGGAQQCHRQAVHAGTQWGMGRRLELSCLLQQGQNLLFGEDPRRRRRDGVGNRAGSGTKHSGAVRR